MKRLGPLPYFQNLELGRLADNATRLLGLLLIMLWLGGLKGLLFPWDEFQPVVKGAQELHEGRKDKRAGGWPDGGLGTKKSSKRDGAATSFTMSSLVWDLRRVKRQGVDVRR